MAPTTQASSGGVFTTLEGEWQRHSNRPRTRRLIRQWADVSPVLAGYVDRDDLVAVAARDCDVLAGLARVAATDSVAMTATLAALIPRLRYISNLGQHERRLTGEAALDAADRQAMIVSIAHEMVLQCHPDDGSTVSYDWRLKCNITRRYRRWLDRQAGSVEARAERLGDAGVTGAVDAIAGDVGKALASAFTSADDTAAVSSSLSDLTSWVAQRAATDLSTAELVVLTRCGGVPIETLVKTQGSTGQTLRQRRRRAERRLADALEAAMT